MLFFPLSIIGHRSDLQVAIFFLSTLHSIIIAKQLQVELMISARIPSNSKPSVDDCGRKALERQVIRIKSSWERSEGWEKILIFIAPFIYAMLWGWWRRCCGPLRVNNESESCAALGEMDREEKKLKISCPFIKKSSIHFIVSSTATRAQANKRENHA